MPVTPDVLDAVRAALAGERRIEESGIEVDGEGEVVVLRGAVPSAEQARAAETVASGHAPAVGNRLRVDPHLREDTSGTGSIGKATPDRGRPARSEELTVQGPSGEPEVLRGEQPTDAHAALAENLPLDPPDAPQGAPTPDEQRDRPLGEVEVEEPADPGEVPEDESWSMPDVSRAELRRAAGTDPDADEPPHEETS